MTEEANLPYTTFLLKKENPIRFRTRFSGFLYIFLVNALLGPHIQGESHTKPGNLHLAPVV